MPRLPPRNARHDTPQSAPPNHRIYACSSRQHAPPTALSPRDRRVCLCCPSLTFSGSNRAFTGRFHRIKSINPIRTTLSSDVDPASAAPPRLVRCWDIASSGPSYDQSRPRSESSGNVWRAPSSGQSRDAAQSTCLLLPQSYRKKNA